MNAQESQTLSALLRRPVYSGRFAEVLGGKAPQFVSSLIQVGQSMPDVEPKSIIAAAMTAAALDLPINKNLGFAWIVPYVGKGRKLAQFQMGYKGYIQLGLRTSQYQRMNARLINADAFKGYDDIGEPIIDWNELDEQEEPIGYCFAWRLTNGFSKLCYWPKAKVQAHARRYSQAFRKQSGPWETHPHEMALKTVIKNELAKWGILSVQMERAYREDSAVRVDDESEPLQLDDFSEAPESVSGGDNPQRDKCVSVGASVSHSKAPERVATEDRSAGASNLPSAGTGPTPGEKVPLAPANHGKVPAEGAPVAGDVSKQAKDQFVSTPADAPAPSTSKRKRSLPPQSEMPIDVPAVSGPVGDSPFKELANGCEAHGISFDRFRQWIIRAMPHIKNADSMSTWTELPEKWVRLWLKSGELLYQEVKR